MPSHFAKNNNMNNNNNNNNPLTSFVTPSKGLQKGDTYFNISSTHCIPSPASGSASYPAAFLGSTPPNSDCLSHLKHHPDEHHPHHSDDEDTCRSERSERSSLNSLAATSSGVSSATADSQQKKLKQQEQYTPTGSTDEGDSYSSAMMAPMMLEDGSFTPVLPSMYSLYPVRNPSSQGNVPWRCHGCNAYAFGHRCSCCSKPRDAAALRVFVGQLCREHSADVISSMIETLCGDELSGPLLHIEPHTHARTGFGKGCCWLYVNAREDVATIVRRLHKRAFCTISEYTGEVGYRSVGAVDACGNYLTSEEAVADMCRQEMATLTQEARELLHYSSPVTAEVPIALSKAMSVRQDNGNKKPRFAPSLASAFSAPAAPPPCKMVASAPVMPAAATIAKAAAMAVGETAKVVATSSPASSEKPAKQSAATPCRYQWNPYSATSPRVVLRARQH